MPKRVVWLSLLLFSLSQIRPNGSNPTDGVLPSQVNEHAQTSLGSPSSTSKVQRIAHILQRAQTEASGFKADFKPVFVFLIP